MIPMYNTKKFTDFYSNVDAFLQDYKNNGLPTTISDANAKTLFYLLYAKYGNSSISNLDENQLSLYNPNQNAMLTYFNNTHVEKLKPLDNQEDFNTYINTKKDFNGLDNLGVFTKTEDSYNPVKITVFIWLEGYDSDFIRGVDNPKISCYLNFMKKEVTEDEIA